MREKHHHAPEIPEAAAKQLLREGWTLESGPMHLYLLGPHGERMRYLEGRAVFVPTAEVALVDAA